MTENQIQQHIIRCIDILKNANVLTVDKAVALKDRVEKFDRTAYSEVSEYIKGLSKTGCINRKHS